MDASIGKQRIVKRRFRVRWSLRSLLVFVTLSAVAARFVGAEFLAYDAEQRGLAALDKVGELRVEGPHKYLG